MYRVRVRGWVRKKMVEVQNFETSTGTGNIADHPRGLPSRTEGLVLGVQLGSVLGSV